MKEHEIMTFADRVIAGVHDKGTPCIVGLDPNIALMPEALLKSHNITGLSSREAKAQMLFNYNCLVIDAIHDLVATVKPQISYYERYGSAGIAALERTVSYAKAKNLLVIMDAKRGDIGATSEAYADAYLDSKEETNPLECDCMTLHPYLGADSLEPFIRKVIEREKGVFVCVKNSNPGARALQSIKTEKGNLYEVVASFVGDWASETVSTSGYSSVGAVVGADSLAEAQHLRKLLPQSLFLVPGVGAQGGSLDVVRACFNSDGLGALVNASRSIMYPYRFGYTSGNLTEQIRNSLVDLRNDIASCIKP